MDFPNYQEWVDIVARRDANLILLSVLTLVAIVWLIDARFISKRGLPLVRIGLISVFYLTLGLSVVGII